MALRDLIERLQAAGIEITDDQEIEFVTHFVNRMQQEPASILAELIQERRRHRAAREHCKTATEAAGGLEELLKKLLEGNAILYHCEVVRMTPEEPKAVARVGNQLRELPIHPNVDVDEIRGLKPWEFVCVNEQVVVGVWRDDPALFDAAQGDIVDFKAYSDRDRNQVRVTRHGHGEEIVTLAESLRDRQLTACSKLILMRDNPRWAIASLEAEITQSRFEVPLDKIDRRLDDLACMESLTETLMEEVLMRVVFPDVRQQFDLDPMRGMLLYSYKPGMGKTHFAEGFAVWLRNLGKQLDFDVVLYVVKPNETKSMWHGEDSRIMREDLFGAIRGRQAIPRTRPLFQLVVFDEIDSLGKRSDHGSRQMSAAHSDSLESLLVEMDGLAQGPIGEGPPAQMLCIGLTNRPDGLDDAAKRPGRFGDLVLAIPDLDSEGAENVMAIYARSSHLSWYLDGTVHKELAEGEIREQILRPAVARLFPAVVLHYYTDTQRKIDVTSGDILSGAHYREVMNKAKKRAARRYLREFGVPAVSFEDIADSLLDVALSVAQQMEADPGMLVRQLNLKVPVARVDTVSREELEDHCYLSVH